MPRTLSSLPFEKTVSPRSAGRQIALQLLTVKAIAILDGCSEKTVRRAIEAGLLEAMRIGPGGRLIRIHPEAHEAYRKAQRL